MKVLLGVGGGIAAYKAAELARLLMERGHQVQVVMTEAAQEFVRPLTFTALTRHKVIAGMFGADTMASSIEHIEVAQSSDVFLVAPATANLIAKFAAGIADDFLSTAFLAYDGPVVIAPAMNTNMWDHAATRQNVETLRARGAHIVEPESGELACGTVGAGRLAALDAIADAVDRTGAVIRDLAGETVLITAGPTREPIDPVRYISNRSSGKMGYALAEEAAARGARVVLVSGPVRLKAPRGVELVPVQTAIEMRQAVMDRLADASIIVKAAAVADYHIANVPTQKVKKTAMRVTLALDPTPDILAEVGRNKGDRLLIGFAAETENLVEEATRKLKNKNCDMVVANLVGPALAFDKDENEVVLVMSTGETVKLPMSAKREVAARIFDHALRLRLALHTAG